MGGDVLLMVTRLDGCWGWSEGELGRRNGAGRTHPPKTARLKASGAETPNRREDAIVRVRVWPALACAGCSSRYVRIFSAWPPTRPESAAPLQGRTCLTTGPLGRRDCVRQAMVACCGLVALACSLGSSRHRESTPAQLQAPRFRLTLPMPFYK